MAKIDLSVIITTHRRADALPTLLSCLERQDMPASRYEVVIVSYGHSSGEDAAMVDRYAAGSPMSVHCLWDATANEITARNLGAENTEGTWLLFLDQDLLAGRHLLSTHVNAHVSGKTQRSLLGAVGRHTSLPRGALTKWFMKHDSDLVGEGRCEVPWLWSSRHCSLSRRVFLDAGGFVPLRTSLRGADIDLALRLQERGIATDCLPGVHAFIWRAAPFNDERQRFLEEGYDLARLAEHRNLPELERYFRLRGSRTRYWLDGLFTPFYARACDATDLDIRAHGLSCRRVFTHDQRRGARAAHHGIAYEALAEWVGELSG